MALSLTRLPSVIITEVLSFLLLHVGNGDASRDSFIRVSRQWLTCARAITRPCIEWTKAHDTTCSNKRLEQL